MPTTTVDRACPLGLTRTELAAVLGDRLPEFDHWMRGQTMAICDGQSPPSRVCAGEPHGVVAYEWDFNRFLRGLPVLD